MMLRAILLLRDMQPPRAIYVMLMPMICESASSAQRARLLSPRHAD
jgi:hypothetical protein